MGAKVWVPVDEKQSNKKALSRLIYKCNEQEDKSIVRFTTRVDSKGRILIPVEVRKSMGINNGQSIELFLSLSNDIVFLRNGCSGQNIKKGVKRRGIQ